MRFKIISPNLDRRPDRWAIFYETLISQNVPPENIERLSSHDGRDYESTHNAMGHAAEIYRDNPPHYLATGERLDKFNWCWNWSWYDCLDRIAKQTDDMPAMFLIDDFKVNFEYNEICNHIDILTGLEDEFLFAQYGGPEFNSPFRVNHEVIPELPIFQRGSSGAWDICVLYSPTGARWMVNLINNTNEHNRPCKYGYLAANEPIQIGMYGASTNTKPWRDWIARLPTAEDDQIQDRQEIEKTWRK